MGDAVDGELAVDDVVEGDEALDENSDCDDDCLSTSSRKRAASRSVSMFIIAMTLRVNVNYIAGRRCVVCVRESLFLLLLPARVPPPPGFLLFFLRLCCSRTAVAVLLRQPRYFTITTSPPCSAFMSPPQPAG